MDKGRTPYMASGPFLLSVVLAACSPASTPSSEDNRQLANAEEMLNSAPGELSDIDENALAQDERDPINTGEPER
jgi:hypothetical protein